MAQLNSRPGGGFVAELRPKNSKTAYCVWRASALSWAFLMLGAFTSGIRAQGRITAIEKNLRKVDSTAEIICVRHRTRTREARVVVPMDLGLGDELISNSGMVTVKVSCGTGTNLILSGSFHVRFFRPSNAGCKIYSYPKPGSRLNVSTFAPTDVQSGEVKLASKRTKYEIVVAPRQPYKIVLTGRPGKQRPVRPPNNSVSQEIKAFEDPVVVRMGRRLSVIPQGEKITASGNKISSNDRIKPADVRAAASEYTKIDMSQLPPDTTKEVRDVAYVNLLDLHAEVLADPHNVEKQRQLANKQRQYRISVASLQPPSSKKDRRVPLASQPEPEPPPPVVKPSTQPTPDVEKNPEPDRPPTPALKVTQNQPVQKETQVTEQPSKEAEVSVAKPPPEKSPEKVPAEKTNKPPDSSLEQTVTWTVFANTESLKRLTVGNSCDRQIEIKISQKGLPFVSPLTEKLSLAPLSETAVEFIVETSQVKTGTHHGALVFDCLNCTKEEKCVALNSPLGVEVLSRTSWIVRPEYYPEIQGNKWDWVQESNSQKWLRVAVINPDEKPHQVLVRVENLSFLRVVLKSEKPFLNPHLESVIPIEINTNGIKPGTYRGRLVLSCLDCSVGDKQYPEIIYIAEISITVK
jgi:hypothetical protein